jgi:hypothetical protein
MNQLQHPVKYTMHRTGQFKTISIQQGRRIIPPTPEAVDAMVASLRDMPQLQPILIRRTGADGYAVVAGAKRLAAAKKLKWSTIAAQEISAANEHEYRIIECEENLARETLSPQDRKTLEAARLEADRQRAVIYLTTQKEEPEKSKRSHRATGNKPSGRPEGGVRKAARDANVPHRVVRTVAKKLEGGGAPFVSPTQKAPRANTRTDGTPMPTSKSIPVTFNQIERGWLATAAAKHHYKTIAELVRRYTIEGLERDGIK